jgi:hypothetical protein
MVAPYNAAPGYVTVPTPPLLPPRVSLLTAADVLDNDTPRWEGGHAYFPETCDRASVDTVCPSEGQYGDVTSTPDQVEVNPFFIYATDQSSTFNRKTRDFPGRASRNVLASEAYWLEHELMLNSLALPGNPYILDPAVVKTTVTSSAIAPWHALARVEQAAATDLPGERILIHVRPKILLELAGANLVRREGNVWLTPMDSIIVPGRGYPGTGPNGEAPTWGSEWIYATGRVQVRRGSIEIIPGQVEKTTENPFGIPPQAINRQTNDIHVTAQRIVSVSFNPQCAVIAAEVDNRKSVWGDDSATTGPTGP